MTGFYGGQRELNENCLFYAFVIDMSGRIGDQGKAFINKIKALSTSSDNSKYKEQFLRRRISYLSLNRGAIARESESLLIHTPAEFEVIRNK